MDIKKELYQSIVSNNVAGKKGENIINDALKLDNPKQYIQMEIIRLKNEISNNLNILYGDWEFIGRDINNLSKFVSRLEKSKSSLDALWEIGDLKEEFDILGKYIPTIIVLEDYLQRPLQEDIFTVEARNRAKKLDRDLINDIKEYIKSHPAGVDIYALISYLYNCKNVVRDKKLKETDWKNIFCRAFFIEDEKITHYKSGNTAIKKKIPSIESEFYYID